LFEIVQSITPLDHEDEDNPIIWYDFMKSVNKQDPGCKCAVHAIDVYTSMLQNNDLYDKLVSMLHIQADDRVECTGVKCRVIEHTRDTEDFPAL